MSGMTLDLVAKALLCQQAEHKFAGVPCGIMDQFASTMCQADHLMLLDCRSREIEQIPFVDPNITVLIINSNVKHGFPAASMPSGVANVNRPHESWALLHCGI